MKETTNKNPRYIDAHSHPHFPQFDDDRDAVLARLQQQNIWTIAVGTNQQTSQQATALAQSRNGIFATVGMHPTEATEDASDINWIPALLKERNVIVGIGECGLDYFRGKDDQAAQKTLFKQQIEYARTYNLPLMLHCRPSEGTMDAYEDTLAILSDFSLGNTPGNVHFFVGTTEVARQFMDLGFTLSFDGPITFTSQYDDVVRFVPIDAILAETDAPFAAPEPFRGKRNEPAYVKEVVQAIARIRGDDERAVRVATVENTRRVFGV